MLVCSAEYRMNDMRLPRGRLARNEQASTSRYFSFALSLLRLFLPSESTINGALAVALSYGRWHRRKAKMRMPSECPTTKIQNDALEDRASMGNGKPKGSDDPANQSLGSAHEVPVLHSNQRLDMPNGANHFIKGSWTRASVNQGLEKEK